MEVVLSRKENALGAILLIAGCCIGAGMIGLPVLSAMTGFIPSTIALFLCYCFTTATGLIFLEATLWFDNQVSFMSIANFALGKVGKAIAGLLFIFLFYCVSVAYFEGGGQLFVEAITALFGITLSREMGIIACTLCVGVVVYGGTRSVSKVNRLFLFGMALSYLALLSFGLPHVQGNALLHTNWKATLSVLPILLICFGYQNLIPTLTHYLRKDIKALRTAIFIGNLIPLIVYFLWNFVILGILSESTGTFSEVVNQSTMVTELLQKASQVESVTLFASLFAFFALFTSFITNSLTFVDFFRDGLKLTKCSKYEIVLYGLVFIPPMIFTLIYPDIFLKALSLAGGFADVLLFGVLPVVIVWIGRYIKKVESNYQVRGGKLLLITLLLLSISLLCITQVGL